jgi:hypothetical protein
MKKPGRVSIGKKGADFLWGNKKEEFFKIL